MFPFLEKNRIKLEEEKSGVVKVPKKATNRICNAWFLSFFS
jgi:hypothetical protein